MYSRRRAKWYHILLIGMFFFVILMPGIDMLVGIDRTPVAGTTAPFPEYRGGLRGLASLPGQFKWYFSDNFGFRPFFIQLHGLYKAHFWKASGSSKVLLGKEGWLYYRDEQTLDDYRNLYPFDEKSLGTWVDMLAARQRFCDARGIDYVFSISPNKPGIYPEYLPDGWAPLGRPKRLDQLQAAVARRLPSVRMVDVRPALLAARKDHLIYYETDTHWNQLGAFVGYREIMAALAQRYSDLDVPSLEDITIETEPSDGGDLARMMGLKFVTDEPLVTPVFPQARQVIREKDGTPLDVAVKDILKGEEGLVTLCEEGEIESAVVIHDSFGQALIPLLARHFKRATFVWSNSFEPELVEKEKPAVVIQQLVERRLVYWEPEPEFEAPAKPTN